MVQSGFTKRIEGRLYEDYISMKKFLGKVTNTRLIEHIYHYNKTSPSSATGVEYANFGTTAKAISDMGKAGITLMCSITNGDDATYTGKIVTAQYLDNLGVAHTATCTLTATMHTTAVAFLIGAAPVTDFYCWNKRDYTPITCLTVNVAVVAGDTLIAHTTGDEAAIWGTISAAATNATDAQLIGVGQIYGAEDGNQADTGYIAELEYYTPWGELKEATWTFPADSSVVTNFVDSTTGYTVGDYYRTYEFEMDHVALDECSVVNAANNAWYSRIDIGNYEELRPHIFVPASSEAKIFMGDINMTNGTASYAATFEVYFQSKGCLVQEKLTWKVGLGNISEVPICMELEPLSDVQIKLADDAAHPCVTDVTIRWIELLPI
jgi:hypothetical protein